MIKLIKIIRDIVFSDNHSKSTSYKSEIDSSSFKFSQLKELWPFIYPEWRKGLIAAIILIFSTLLTTVQPLCSKFIIDDVIIKKNTELLVFIIVILIGISLAAAILSLLNKYLFFRIEQKIIVRIQSKLFQRVLRFPMSFFDNKQTGYLMSRLLNDVFQLRILFSSSIVSIFTNILLFSGSLTILFILHWKLTLLSIIILPLFIISISTISKKIRILSYIMMEKTALVSRNLQESISGVEVIKSFTSEDHVTNKLNSSLKESVTANVERNTINAFTEFVINIISSFGVILVMYYGTREIINDNLTIGSFVAFYSYIAYLYGPSRFLATMHVNLQSAFAALERVFAIFDLIPEYEDDSSKILINRLKGEVIFKDVTFSYDNQTPALKNISFTANPGETVAIVGPTGAGKSTLVKLIIGFYQINKGRLFFDGDDVSKLNLRTLRERIGIVSQEIFLFDDTIMNNIRYGNPKATDEEVIAISKTANAHEFIKDLDDGYQAKVGERGVKFSTGQKQRISIARALLKNPDILIFDEPTSALDAITEKAIKKIIFKNIRKNTVFIIAHRLSTIAEADKIIVMNHGRIVHIGKHENLINHDELYTKMYKGQFMRK